MLLMVLILAFPILGLALFLVLPWNATSGTVRCHGEIWRARTAEAAVRHPDVGSVVKVVAVSGLDLIVRPPSEI